MLRKTVKITQIRVLPVEEQTDPDGVKMPDEWRINVYRDVIIDDDEDPDFSAMQHSDVQTFRRSDPWGTCGVPEVVELGTAVFAEAVDAFIGRPSFVSDRAKRPAGG